MDRKTTREQEKKKEETGTLKSYKVQLPLKRDKKGEEIRRRKAEGGDQKFCNPEG